MHVEICVDASPGTSLVRNLRAASLGGARRVELCVDAAIGGLGPPPDLIRRARQTLASDVELLVLLRPRPGDFLYTPDECRHMRRGIAQAAACGADGVVLGALRHGARGCTVDWNTLDSWLDESRRHGLAVTFHRAFEELARPQVALEGLIERGVQRVLCNGRCGAEPSTSRPLDNLARLQELQRISAGRLELVVGGGLTLSGAPELVRELVASGGRFSLHSHGAVLREGRVCPGRVRQLVRAGSTAQRNGKLGRGRA